MASVYQRKGSEVWMAKWSVYDPDSGKWKQVCRSTGCRDKVDAEDVARKRQDAARDAAKRLGVRKHEKPAPAEISEAEYSRVARRLQQGAIDGKVPAPPIAECKDAWLRQFEDDTTRSNYRGCVNRFEKWIRNATGRDNESMDDVTPAMVEDFRDYLVNEKRLSARRVNFHLSALRSLWSRSVRFGVTSQDPAAPVVRVRLDRSVDDLPATPFTDAELERLYLAPFRAASLQARNGGEGDWSTEMAVEWEIVIRLGAVVGMRLADSYQFKVSAFDLEEGTLDYLPAKTRKSSGKRILFPLKFWPDLLRFLRATHEGTGFLPGDWLTPRIRERAAENANWPSRAFGRLMQLADIPVTETRPKKGEGRSRKSHGFHSLRHTAVTAAARAGLPVDIRRALFGHASDRMNLRYTQLDQDALERLISQSMERGQRD